MKKLSRSLVILMAALALTACGNSEKAAPSGGNTSDDSSDLNVISDNSSDKLNTEPLKSVTENLRHNFDELKSDPHVNIDWNGAAIGYPVQGISECYAIKKIGGYELHPDKTMTAEEQLAQFESYCKSYLGEYNTDFACFDTKNRELSDDVYTIDGIDGETFTDFPKIEEYRDKIINGSIQPTWYLYVDHERQIYLWWNAETMIYPHWYNKGTALRLLDEYYKASSAIPTDLGEPVAVYLNDGSHSNESYHLLDGDVTVGDALDWFSGNYPQSLGVIADEDVNKLAVRQINVYLITEDTYAFVFLFTPALNGIPLDYEGERIIRVSQGEEPFNSVTYAGQALMIKSNEIDWAVGIAPQAYMEQGDPITEIISLQEAADIMSKSVSEKIQYKAKTEELILTANSNTENPDPVLVPTWKFTLLNDNDGFLYDFYIGAVSGILDGYVRYENNE